MVETHRVNLCVVPLVWAVPVCCLDIWWWGAGWWSFCPKPGEASLSHGRAAACVCVCGVCVCVCVCGVCVCVRALWNQSYTPAFMLHLRYPAFQLTCTYHSPFLILHITHLCLSAVTSVLFN